MSAAVCGHVGCENGHVKTMIGWVLCPSCVTMGRPIAERRPMTCLMCGGAGEYWTARFLRSDKLKECRYCNGTGEAA